MNTINELIQMLEQFPAHYKIDMQVGYTGRSCQIQHLLCCPKTQTVQIYTDQDEP
jgi:hypothetical protein